MALAALCTGGLVRADSPGFAAFNHALLRQAIYDDIPEPVRAQMHAGALRILWRRGIPSGECPTIPSIAGKVGCFGNERPSTGANRTTIRLPVIAPEDPARRPRRQAGAYATSRLATQNPSRVSSQSMGSAHPWLVPYST